MTQSDLATWAMKEYGSTKPPSQTTISRILSSKSDIIASKEDDFKLVRRRKQTNPLLRKILTEWITQATWESIPVTTPIIQSTAHAIWTRLPKEDKTGNGVFNQKWCSHFIKKLNINITGSEEDIKNNFGYKLNKVWMLDEKVELKNYLDNLIQQDNYSPQDIFVIDEFQLFYSLPLDQIFDVSSVDKGLQQSHSSNEYSLTALLGCNIDGSEKLLPLIVGKYDKFDVSKSSFNNFQVASSEHTLHHNLMNKITQMYNISYKSNTNKWVTSSMFQNYILSLDHKIHSLTPERKILIILDDCSSHRLVNIKFQNIKLVYLKNETCHKNPYNTSYGSVKFDYLPMNFGIIEEFKIFYRIQQYTEMIKLQRSKSMGNNNNRKKPNSGTSPLNLNYEMANTSPALEVLAEQDYHVSMIQVIEWVTRAWSMVSPERIYQSWKKTRLLPLSAGHNWPSVRTRSKADEICKYLDKRLVVFDEMKSHRELEDIMGQLNVVIPWEIEELVGLVNERGKITLSYASIEEIIGSCLSESIEDDGPSDDEDDGNNRDMDLANGETEANDVVNSRWSINESDLKDASNIIFNKAIASATNANDTMMNMGSISPALKNSFTSTDVLLDSSQGFNQGSNGVAMATSQSPTFPFGSPLMGANAKHKLGPLENWNKKKPASSILSPQRHRWQNNINQLFDTSLANGPAAAAAAADIGAYGHSSQQHSQHEESQSQNFSADSHVDNDMLQSISKLINYSSLNTINLSQATIDDLNYNLKIIQSRLGQTE
ncbi:PDC2 [Candida theae]|uniref:PDC2 n=1 Tax=Candida theae TaxID=1198502 RepID=A0AAD5BFL9_9ASCO|nr:PDC2 [Candida theae]KAI5958796.1 PDC2 [Candida theae]